jgi:hypothetical protein
MWFGIQHGHHCSNGVWKTKCPECGERVYYWSCSHGSKVFFDSLGPDWLKHDCLCHRQQGALVGVKRLSFR